MKPKILVLITFTVVYILFSISLYVQIIDTNAEIKFAKQALAQQYDLLSRENYELQVMDKVRSINRGTEQRLTIVDANQSKLEGYHLIFAGFGIFYFILSYRWMLKADK
jgi:hypothetical protein